MKTLLMPARYTADSIELRVAAMDFGHDVLRFQYWRAPEWLQTAQLYLYGEPLFTQIMAAQLKLGLLEPTPELLAELPYKWRKRHVQAVSLAELPKVDQRCFIKPADEKFFAAGIYANGAEVALSPDLPDDLPILISDTVAFSIEFRAFVLDGEVAALSPYVRDGKLAQDESGQWFATAEEWQAARQFLEQLLTESDLPLPPGVVIDVGLIPEQGWAVVEFNAAQNSGICGCNASDVLPVLERCSVALDSEQATTDQPWLIRAEQAVALT